MAKLGLVLAALALVAGAVIAAPTPTNLKRYYSAYPAPTSILQYLDGLFTCSGNFALCAYATCVPIPNSNPPVAECGCYAFSGKSLGSASGVLNKPAKDATLKLCQHSAKCLTVLGNRSPFCKAMNSGTLFPGYPLVSTYNPNDWAAATNQSGTIPPGSYAPKACRGGTFTNCFSAACRTGPPTSKFLPAGAPAYNATCYCPYMTTKQRFLMGSQDAPCGPTDPKQVKPSTLIYNGL